MNWYLVEGGKYTAIDAGLPRFRDDLEADLAAVGAKPGDVEAVVLTHSDPTTRAWRPTCARPAPGS